MMVKVCGFRTAEEARQAAEAGADALGFNFYPPSPRYVDPADAAWIREMAGVVKVGVFVREAPEIVTAIVRALALDVVQIHGGEIPAGMRAWRALPVDDAFDPECLKQPDVEAFLLDAPARALPGGTGKTFDWRRAAGLPGKIVLAGGLSAENVAEAIRIARPWGVDACSRLEAEPGRKDPEKVAAFIRAAKEAA
jgi:phosphoribosylanthranilate isomerase